MDYLPYRRKTILQLAYCTSMRMHFVLCEIFDVKHWNVNEKFNNTIYEEQELKVIWN